MAFMTQQHKVRRLQSHTRIHAHRNNVVYLQTRRTEMPAAMLAAALLKPVQQTLLTLQRLTTVPHLLVLAPTTLHPHTRHVEIQAE